MEEENIVDANLPRKSQRTKNFTPNEDICIVSAWLNTSKDAIHGGDQTSSRFWKRIYNDFVTNCNGDRTEQSIKNRWRDINAQCAKFAGCLNQINNRHQSGQTDHGKLDEARALYAANIKQKSFKFEHCYDLLKHERKWLDIFETNKQTNAASDSVSMASEEDSVSMASANKERPMGRKASMEQLKRKQGRTEGENSSTMSLINEQWEERMAIEREKNAQRERLLEAISHPRITLVDPESKEMEIMSKDTSGMDARHVAYWKMKKDEILRKHGL